MPVDFNRVSFAVSEYRKTDKRQDLAVQAREPLSTELEFNTILEAQEDAETFGDEVLELRKSHGRNDWVLNIRKGAISPEIGDTIFLTYPRFGLSSGKSFIVKRIKRSQSGLYDEFTLFGPYELINYEEYPPCAIINDQEGFVLNENSGYIIGSCGVEEESPPYAILNRDGSFVLNRDSGYVLGRS